MHSRCSFNVHAMEFCKSRRQIRLSVLIPVHPSVLPTIPNAFRKITFVGAKPLLVFEDDETPSANAKAQVMALLQTLVVQGNQHRVDLLHLTFGQDRENKIENVMKLAKSWTSLHTGLSLRMLTPSTPWLSQGLKAYLISHRARRFLLSEAFVTKAIDVHASKVLIGKFGPMAVQVACPPLMENDIDASLAFRDSRRFMILDGQWGKNQFCSMDSCF